MKNTEHIRAKTNVEVGKGGGETKTSSFIFRVIQSIKLIRIQAGSGTTVRLQNAPIVATYFSRGKGKTERGHSIERCIGC